MRSLCLITFALVACGAPKTRKPEATATAQTVDSGRAFKHARILYVEPTQEYLDLGPIAASAGRGSRAFREWLVLEADRLDADALEQLRALATLDEQLRWAHGRVITGRLARQSYEALRTRLARGGSDQARL